MSSQIKLKHITRFVSGVGFPEDMQGLTEGHYPFMKVSDINGLSRTVTEANNYVSKEDVAVMGWRPIAPGSILMAKIGAALTKNHRKILKKPAMIDNNMMAATPSGVDKDFFYWLWQTIDLTDHQNISSVPSVNMESLKNVSVRLPTQSKQKSIADYLDSKTQTIDKMLTAKNHTHKHLSELRQAIIDRTILEVDMSDLQALKRVSSMINRGASPSYADDGKVKFINQACIYSDGIKFSAVKTADELAHATDGRGYLHKGDLLVNSTGTGTLGRVAVFDHDNDGTYFADSHVTIVRPNFKKIDPEYLRYVMLSTKFQDEVYTLCVSGSTNQIELSRERFRELQIPVPPLAVQRDIVSELNWKIKNIDEANEVLKKSISQLEEYRSSLISNVVGGKVEV